MLAKPTEPAKYVYTIFAGLCLFLTIILCPLAYAQNTWQAGDLIFREGNGPISDMVLSLGEGKFSHVGMLVGKPGAWQVVHATPEETTGRGDVVVVDYLSFFIDPKRSRQYAIYQVQATPQAHQQAVAAALQNVGKPFSILETGLYCTTLIEQAWFAAGVDLQAKYTTISVPMMAGEYLFPSGLLASPLLEQAE